ncbi:MAG: transcriptional regulator [Phycisphaerae bacterium]|nr:transcriptional regulator [Phycisphaerae bacterium]
MRATQINAKDIAALDKVLHEPGRLGVVACLYVVKDADFVFLQSQTDMTVGNLSSHLKRLEQAGYVAVKKEFVDAKPRTVLSLTKSGRTAFDRYIETLKVMLRAIG